MIYLPDFQHKAYHFERDLILFKGHESFKKIATIRQSKTLGNIIAAHVSAKGLSSSNVPTLLQHHKLNPTDRTIWTAAYREEYDGIG